MEKLNSGWFLDFSVCQKKKPEKKERIKWSAPPGKNMYYYFAMTIPLPYSPHHFLLLNYQSSHTVVCFCNTLSPDLEEWVYIRVRPLTHLQLRWSCQFSTFLSTMKMKIHGHSHAPKGGKIRDFRKLSERNYRECPALKKINYWVKEILKGLKCLTCMRPILAHNPCTAYGLLSTPRVTPKQSARNRS